MRLVLRVVLSWRAVRCGLRHRDICLLVPRIDRLVDVRTRVGRVPIVVDEGLVEVESIPDCWVLVLGVGRLR